MSVSSIVDIVFVALLILLAVIGLYKGFLKSAISMVGSLASFLISYVIAKPFGSLLNSIFKLTDAIAGKVSDWLYSLGEFFSTVRTGEEFSAISGEMASGGISGVVQKLTNLLLKGLSIPNGESVGSVLGEKIAVVITTVIAGVIAFVLIRIILKILEKLSDKLTEVKIFGAIDKVLGFIFGLAKGLVYSAAVVLVASVVGYFIPSIDGKIDGIVSETKAFQKYYDYLNYEIVEYIDDKLGKTPADEPKGAAEVAIADFNATKLAGITHVYTTRNQGQETGSVYFGKTELTKDNYATAADFFVKYVSADEFTAIAVTTVMANPDMVIAYQDVAEEKTLTDIEGLYDIITHYYVDTTNKVVYFKVANSDIQVAAAAFDSDYKVTYTEETELTDIRASIDEHNATVDTDIAETVVTE